MTPPDITDQLKRLKRIEGQVRGIARMIEEERSCVEVLTQIRAVHAALRKVESAQMSGHIEECVLEAVNSGADHEREQKLAELVAALERFGSG
ncbi:MAG: metal-sensitive transcriptional regulator [Chrysiogenetes bacterium]|nr:metal-sensitive transcriptional regulator [Chrysiogenetes bacterium]